MDEIDLTALGFPCKQVCRKCSVKLLIGQNWTIGRKKARLYVCKVCNLELGKTWKKENKDKDKLYSYKAIRTTKRRYQDGKTKAKLKKVPWTITIHEYSLLISNPCFYCQDILKSTGIGLDQMIAGNGYTKENVVPCCKECNLAKGYIFTHEEFIPIGNVIKEIKEKRKISKDLS